MTTHKHGSHLTPAQAHTAATEAINKKFNLQRSPAWDDVQKAFRAANPHCKACGETQQLNVHHMFPFHYIMLLDREDLELDPQNLMTLCVRKDREHHILLGHLDDYESYNPNVKQFVQTYAGKTNQQIRADAAWKQAHAAKPKHIDQMTPAEKALLKAQMDAQMPPHPDIVAKAKKARAKMSSTGNT